MKSFLTKEEALNLLAKKGLTENDLYSKIETQSLKSIAKDFRMGYDRILLCVKALEIDTKQLKSKKISQKNYENSKKKRTEILDDIDLEKLEKDLKKFGENYCNEKYGKDVVRSFRKDNKIVLEHSSILQSNVYQDLLNSIKPDIKKMVDDGMSVSTISKKTGLPQGTISSYLKVNFKDRKSVKFAGYSEEDRILAVSKFGNGSIKKSIDKYNNDLLIFKKNVLEFEKDIKKLMSFVDLSRKYEISYKNTVDLINNNFGVSPETDKNNQVNSLRCFVKKNNNKDLIIQNDVAIFLNSKIGNVPFRCSNYPNAYRFFMVLHNREMLKDFFKFLKVEKSVDFVRLFPFVNFADFCCLVDDFDLKNDFFEYSDDEKTLRDIRKAGNSFDTVDDLEFFVKDSGIVSKRGISNLLGISLSELNKICDRQNFDFVKINLSSYEERIAEVIESFGVNFVIHKRFTHDKKTFEADFFFPELNLALEINPLHFHNSTVVPYHGNVLPKSKNYHFEKYKFFKNLGIQLVQLYEKDLIEPSFSNFTVPFLKFKIVGAENVLYGRDTVVVDVTNTKDKKKEIKNFLEKFHEQGFAAANYYYGMYDKKSNVLIGCATFKKRKCFSEVELLRLCYLPDYQVRYGLSKFVKNFLNDYKSVDSIFSFSKNDLGNGTSYENSGFSFVRETGPTLTYVNPQNANDCYSWQVGTSWSAKSGVIARKIAPMEIDNKEANAVVINDLPHKADDGFGYYEVWNSGNKLWKYSRL